MNKNLSFQVGQDNTQLSYCLRWQGPDIYINITGGQCHIGSVAVVIKGSVSVITVPGHKDDFLTRPIAEVIAGVFSGTAVIMAGFHLDDISPNDIKEVLSNNNEAAAQIKACLIAGYTNDTP